MGEPNPLAILFRKRETIRDHVTSLQEFLDRYDENNPDHFSQLKLRSDTVVSSFSHLDRINDEITLLDEKNDHNTEKKVIQDLYYQVLARAQMIYNSVAFLTAQSDRNSFSNATDNANLVSHRRLKLPQASLPTFGGKVADCLSFKGTFNTMVHQFDDISKVQKMQYPKSALKDEALRKIQVLSIADGDTPRASDLLLKSDEDKKTLISRHLSLLLRLPVQEKETSKGLIALADESQQHLQSLAALGITISPEMVVAIIEDKLHKNTLEKWEDSLTKREFPKFDDLIEFLYRAAARLSKRKLDQRNNDTSKNNPPAPKIQKKGDFKRFDYLTNAKRCSLCESNHLLYQCKKFLRLNIHDRIKFVKNTSLCNNCLGNHKSNECKFGNCKKCRKRHNTLLHIERPRNSDKTNVKDPSL